MSRNVAMCLYQCRQPTPLKDVSDSLERFPKNWEESFTRLNNYLRKIQDKTESE